MDMIVVTRIIAIAGIIIGGVGLAFRLRSMLQRPNKKDLSRPRGSAQKGIIYAFTLGMAPWEKESTRLHWVAYLRGIFFHIGVFASYACFFLSPFLGRIAEPIIWILMFLTGAGAIFGFAGIYLRMAGKNERVLSLPDDYFAVFMTSLFSFLAFGVLFSKEFMPAFYLVTGILSIYVPIGKIRHCAYFFYSKFFFGENFGHRGVLGHNNQKTVQ